MLSEINKILQINDDYQAPDRVMEVLGDHKAKIKDFVSLQLRKSELKTVANEIKRIRKSEK